ncbi:hypothetical protein [Diaphorobacter caeni]|uniref:hypothetical protein n=1 Tax=Diaphorobacter caeni TaxID=2784387 RepID=UPI002B26F61B|nr:hypothetical protein [Diaphorobacter caeni]
MLIFMATTESMKTIHGWTGFWIATAVMAVYGILNYFDGYFARQRELEEKLASMGIKK